MSLIVAIVCLFAVAEASVVLSLNGTQYFSPDIFAASIKAGASAPLPTEPTPATVFSVSQDVITANLLESMIAQFLNIDDVFSESFLSSLILSTKGDVTMADDVVPYLDAIGCNAAYFENQLDVPSGPYFLHPSGSLTKVYRLYWDFNFAFAEALIQTDDGQFVHSAGAVQDDITGALSIPVPSRLYFPPTSEDLPLSGIRVGVKDIYDLKGVRTSIGSRAVRQLVAPAPDTAPAIQTLLDLGAVVVGKTKTTQFVIGEYVTADFIDQFGPFNPRGDGYQDPQVSSIGSGSGVSSYEWLDMGTASDTGGSVRLPARACGLFGMRVTTASLPLDGIVPSSSEFDTPGLLVRDAKLLQTAYRKWHTAKDYKSYPKRIILPTEFWPTVNETSMPVYETFISELSSFLGASVEHVNTNDSFIAHTGREEGLTQFTDALYSNITNWEGWYKVGLPFTQDYEAKFGYPPYVNPGARVRWERGMDLPEESYRKALDHFAIYQEWFRSEIVPTCEEALVLYPWGPGFEAYRDEYREPPVAVFGANYASQMQATYAAVPDYSVPIGSRKYVSRITQREEELPVSIGIIAGAGCDHMLADLIVDMGESVEAFRTTVKTGRTLW